MYDWLAEAARSLADSVGDDPGRYWFADGEIDRLLDLAGVAAHEGGHKTNAPLLSYLVGLAHARHPELDLAEVITGAIGDRVPT